MEQLKPVSVDSNPNFQDMEMSHKNQPKVSGESLGQDSSKFTRRLEHPNEADVSMQRLLDSNGKK